MNITMNRRRAVVTSLAALSVLSVGLGAGVAGAQAAEGHHPAQVTGAVSPDTNTATAAGGISKVTVATSDFNDTSASTTTLTPLPGMVAKISVPAGKRALLMARFTAETSCSGGGTTGNWCIAEILVDGVEAHPGDGSDYAMDSTNNGANSEENWQGHALDRSIVVGPGTHTVTVLGAVTDFGGTGTQIFWTGERSLTVERALLG